ncbi:hypothetical protein PPERSA_03873 [Pseudocohnilembus persalinus]|uniref:Uncharacterized protein n=1 Tax=Pseudocohnilembus persalinus TaxID=266149 RepID=A0A0V0Q909_PSEPJ|nr:hypothetical protein PPERSA_03873 [Pseudocohnilembus persalinus]|eukprot:KRW98738.1 hypothetical protein PPERSA_03873 [Pseudocohnilembus persalinus]
MFTPQKQYKKPSLSKKPEFLDNLQNFYSEKNVNLQKISYLQSYNQINQKKCQQSENSCNFLNSSNSGQTLKFYKIIYFQSGLFLDQHQNSISYQANTYNNTQENSNFNKNNLSAKVFLSDQKFIQKNNNFQQQFPIPEKNAKRFFVLSDPNIYIQNFEVMKMSNISLNSVYQQIQKNFPNDYENILIKSMEFYTFISQNQFTAYNTNLQFIIKILNEFSQPLHQIMSQITYNILCCFKLNYDQLIKSPCMQLISKVPQQYKRQCLENCWQVVFQEIKEFEIQQSFQQQKYAKLNQNKKRNSDFQLDEDENLDEFNLNDGQNHQKLSSSRNQINVIQII